MRYPYACPKCSNDFEVYKSVKDIDLEEKCPKCDTISSRYISRTHFYGAGGWDAAEFNPGLGCVVKNKKHREQICKDRGLIELGNEKPETIHKYCDAIRKEKNEKAYDFGKEEIWLPS